MRRRTLLAFGSSSILAAPWIVHAETARTFAVHSERRSALCGSLLDPNLNHPFTRQPNLRPVVRFGRRFPTATANARWLSHRRQWHALGAAPYAKGLLFHDDTPISRGIASQASCAGRDGIRQWVRVARPQRMRSRRHLTGSSASGLKRTVRHPLAEALAQPTCLMMPERVAMTDPL